MAESDSIGKLIMFKSKLIRSEVTAVTFCRNCIFAGIGGFLHIFDCNSKETLHKHKIFEGQKIYKILPSADNIEILIYGEKNISLIKFGKNSDQTKTQSDKNELNFEMIRSKTIHDWIMCARFIENDSKIALVTMHNRLSVWNRHLEILNELECEEKCILYSAHICYQNLDDMVILSGTVFSEILIWKPFSTIDKCRVITRLKSHNGVIFSIDFHEVNSLISSTSDDRSAIVWKIKNGSLLEQISKNSLETSIVVKVYGHFSRIFRCKILENCLATAGEDGQIIIWNFEGKIMKKIEAHQPGPIWCLDYKSSSNMIVSGGADSGIATFNLSSDFIHEKLSIPKGTSKFVGILGSGNLVSLSEQATLFYYNKIENVWHVCAEHEDLKNYSVFQVSLCKNMVALCGFQGQIYIYQENSDKLSHILTYQSLEATRIFSFHWLTCKMFLTCQKDGVLSLFFMKKAEVVKVDEFDIPSSKERWSTSACITKNGDLVVGNRKGDVFLYKTGNKTPVDTVKKAHCNLGVVNIYAKDKFIISLGRNGIFKKFIVTEGKLELLESNKTKYSWLAAIESDNLLAFSGNKFVLSDLKYRRTLFEFDCGGGHRSWSFLKSLKDQNISFVFVKDKSLNLVEIDSKNIVHKYYIEGFHSKEINTLEILEFEDTHVFVSGGEDTTLRLNLLKSNGYFENVQDLKVHLSSIRVVEICKLTENCQKVQDYVMFSGGGRAQIICWNLNLQKDDKGKINISCSEKYSLYEEIDQELPEIRIMDLKSFKKDERILLFSGCSDGNIKVFTLEEDNHNKSLKLSLLRTMFYKYNCIMKIQIINILGKDMLLSMATDGQIVFWDITTVLELHLDMQPIICFTVHESGINSFSYHILNQNEILLLTGGDDNKISFDLFKFKNSDGFLHISRSASFFDSSAHCAQITGTCILENCFVTSAVDQRITVFSWKVSDEKLVCTLLRTYNSSIADLQGLRCFLTDKILNVVIFGKGLEHIQVSGIF